MVVRGLFAASLKGARGVSAAFVCNARGYTACSVRTRGGLISERRPCSLGGFVPSSVREQVGSLRCRSGR